MIRHTLRRLCAATSNKTVRIVECPRDAMQGLRDFVPTADKVRYINALLKVGYDTIDFGSFVSAPAVPQMRDTEDVLKQLDRTGSDSKLLVVVANLRGAAKATSFDAISYVGYPLSASEQFQKQNTNRDVTTALNDLQQMQNLCLKSKNASLVTYISMAFGNPYGEAYDVAKVEALVERVASMGVKTISLADTTGVSEPVLINQLFSTLIPKYPEITFSAHFHSGTISSQAKVKAAVEAGCRRIEGAIGGMGGCPFAKSVLVGNVATESIVETLDSLGFSHGLNIPELRKCEEIKHEIFGIAVKELLLARTLNNERDFTKLCFEHFNRYDRNQTGFMDLSEFELSVKDVFAELGAATPTPEKIKRSFGKLDTQGIGAITVESYIAGARRLLTKKLKELEDEEV